MYFIANDPRVPEDVRSEMAKWGLAKDEFVDNGNWPHQIYVRESRRMRGEYVMTEKECLAERETPNSVGMGLRPQKPYTIAYGSLTPKKEEAVNLLVPVCVSASHIAYGSIRMEPVFMILGQSAATAASLAIDEEIAVQDVAYERLRARLLADGQVLGDPPQ